MKKLTLLLLVIPVIFTLAACSSALQVTTGGSVYYTATLEMKKDNKELYGTHSTIPRIKNRRSRISCR